MSSFICTTKQFFLLLIYYIEDRYNLTNITKKPILYIEYNGNFENLLCQKKTNL